MVRFEEGKNLDMEKESRSVRPKEGNHSSQRSHSRSTSSVDIGDLSRKFDVYMGDLYRKFDNLMRNPPGTTIPHFESPRETLADHSRSLGGNQTSVVRRRKSNASNSHDSRESTSHSNRSSRRSSRSSRSKQSVSGESNISEASNISGSSNGRGHSSSLSAAEIIDLYKYKPSATNEEILAGKKKNKSKDKYGREGPDGIYRLNPDTSLVAANTRRVKERKNQESSVQQPYTFSSSESESETSSYYDR